MKNQKKMQFSKCTREFRRWLHEASRHAPERFRMDHIVPRPSVVTLTDGRSVKYTGP